MRVRVVTCRDSPSAVHGHCGAGTGEGCGESKEKPASKRSRLLLSGLLIRLRTSIRDLRGLALQERGPCWRTKCHMSRRTRPLHALATTPV
jgi:hypothetical protein